MSRERGFLTFVLGALVAVPVTLLAQRDGGFPRVLADGVAQAPPSHWLLAVGNTDQGRGTRETVFVLDPLGQRLAVYTWSTGNGALTLSAVREITYDLKTDEYSNAGKDVQSPSVRKVKEKWEESQAPRPGRPR